MLGLCNVPYNMFKSIRESLQLPLANITYVGLNHLSWITAIEHQMYSDSRLHTKPELLSSRGGANYSEVAISLVDAIYNDKQEVHVVNLLNRGALEFMEDSDAVEVGALIGKDGYPPQSH